mmetsp:Transcript_4025/g.5516  ORF Transcript_4025/g.5516 Transcript_4025/m.5516 type:complete len:80 (-) Transcript_4025:2307-2546(-)
MIQLWNMNRWTSVQQSWDNFPVGKRMGIAIPLVFLTCVLTRISVETYETPVVGGVGKRDSYEFVSSSVHHSCIYIIWVA